MQNITVVPPECPDFERAVLVLQVEFHLRQWGTRAEHIVTAWSETFPTAVEAGRQLHE